MSAKQRTGVRIYNLPTRTDVSGIHVGGSVYSSFVANNLTIGGDVRMPSRMAYPAGSVGADVLMKGYIDYLIARYFEFRKSDSSYGAARPFTHAALHRNIQGKFKAKTFFILSSRFEELTNYLQQRIDATIQGKRNRAHGHRNYVSWMDYRDEQQESRNR